jgi:hypothetical protein
MCEEFNPGSAFQRLMQLLEACFWVAQRFTAAILGVFDIRL